jgi:predicted LPLAT superfamily acyltransferase
VSTQPVDSVPHWADHDERGVTFAIRLLFGIYRVLGRSAFTVLLYPVIAYFFLTGGAVRRASGNYLQAVRARLEDLGRPVPRHLTVFRHLVEFGNGMLDKLAIWSNALPADLVAAEDLAVLERFRSGGRGVLFIGSHHGNLEVLRAVGDRVPGLTINALVDTRNSPKLNCVFAATSPQTLERMIQIDSLGPESVSMLRDKLAAGEHIAIAADRVSVRHTERSLQAPFLGRPAPFPQGAFVLASLLECPVYLLFFLKIDGRYRVFLEPFADPLVLPRFERREALERVIEHYATRLEEHCLMAPTQWFNFFDFWGQASGRR